ncbi:MAG TPA: Gldg family protein [Chloroflexota bacterium]|nr:Gldg family protein [Chloroflexota bacterium]
MAALLDRIRLPVLALGLLALLAALAWYLVTGEFGIPPRVLLVVGVLLVGIYVAIEPREVATALGSRGARYGGNTLLAALVFLGILALANFLVIRHSQRWDVTANQVFTLSDQTRKVLDSLPAPVHVTVFAQPGTTQTDNLETLLRNYEVNSGGRLTWELIDPDANPGAARQFNIRQYNTLVFQMGDKRQDTTGLTESDLTGALIKLTATVQPKVYFLTGHGERNTEGFTPDSYSEIKRALQGDNYQVETLNLLTTGSVPEDAAALIVANPQNPLLPEELQAIQDYLDRAGRLFLLVDPRSAPGLQALVERWGITFSGVVVDRGSFLQVGQVADPLSPVVQKYTFHPITKDLMRDNVPVVLIEATAINVPTERQEGVTITKLAETSGERSYVKAVDAGTLEFIEGEDQRGPITLAVAVEAEAPNAPPSTDPNAPPGTRPKTRVVIVGDSDFATNNALRLPLGNRDFFVNAVNWLSGSEALASIRPRPPEQRTLFLSSVQRNTIFFSTVFFIPLLVLAAGGLVWWSRR